MPGNQQQIRGDDGRPDVALEGTVASPGATVQPKGSFQKGDKPFNAGAKTAELAIYPRALDHVDVGEA